MNTPDAETAAMIDRACEAFKYVAIQALELVTEDGDYRKAVNKILNEIDRQYGIAKHKTLPAAKPYAMFVYLTLACNELFVACWEKGQEYIDSYYPTLEDYLITAFSAKHPEVTDDAIVHQRAPAHHDGTVKSFYSHYKEQLLLRYTTALNVSQLGTYATEVSDQLLTQLEEEFGLLDGIRAKLLEVLSTHRKLGVKPSFYPDPLLADKTMSWVFYDPLEFLEKVGVAEDVKVGDILAGVLITPTMLIDSLELVTADYRPEGYNGTLTRKSFRTSFPQACTGVITTDGRLDFSYGRGYYTFDKLSPSQHRTNQLLELQALSLVAELVCPVEVVSESIPHQVGVNGPGKTNEIGKLIVPRIRRLLASPSVHQTNGTRSIRIHDVVWHIRKLPEGWEHTNKAQEFAELHGISLAPGETFVREHQRGSEENGHGPKVHLLVRK